MVSRNKRSIDENNGICYLLPRPVTWVLEQMWSLSKLTRQMSEQSFSFVSTSCVTSGPNWGEGETLDQSEVSSEVT